MEIAEFGRSVGVSGYPVCAAKIPATRQPRSNRRASAGDSYMALVTNLWRTSKMADAVSPRTSVRFCGVIGIAVSPGSVALSMAWPQV